MPPRQVSLHPNMPSSLPGPSSELTVTVRLLMLPGMTFLGMTGECSGVVGSVNHDFKDNRQKWQWKNLPF